MNEAEKKVAESLGLTPERLELLQQQVAAERRVAAERQLSKRELAVCEAIHMTAEKYLANKVKAAVPEMTPDEMRKEQARILRKTAQMATGGARARILARADALERGEDIDQDK